MYNYRYICILYVTKQSTTKHHHMPWNDCHPKYSVDVVSGLGLVPLVLVDVKARSQAEKRSASRSGNNSLDEPVV